MSKPSMEAAVAAWKNFYSSAHGNPARKDSLQTVGHYSRISKWCLAGQDYRTRHNNLMLMMTCFHNDDMLNW